MSVYYVSAVKLVQTMKRDYDQNSLHYRLSTHNCFPLMIVDEIGYLQLSREESNLLFQFVSSGYKRRSTIYESNKGFSEWGEVFVDQVMASVVLDRILHHCSVINICDESYRLKDRRRNSLPTERRVRRMSEFIYKGGESHSGIFWEISTGVYDLPQERNNTEGMRDICNGNQGNMPV